MVILPTAMAPPIAAMRLAPVSVTSPPALRISVSATRVPPAPASAPPAESVRFCAAMLPLARMAVPAVMARLPVATVVPAMSMAPPPWVVNWTVVPRSVPGMAICPAAMVMAPAWTVPPRMKAPPPVIAMSRLAPDSGPLLRMPPAPEDRRICPAGALTPPAGAIARIPLGPPASYPGCPAKAATAAASAMVPPPTRASGALTVRLRPACKVRLVAAAVTGDCTMRSRAAWSTTLPARLANTAGSILAEIAVAAPPLFPTVSEPPPPDRWNRALSEPPVRMMRSCGSISNVPAGPAGALTSTLPVRAKSRLPETSTSPPAPPPLPPVAVMRPAMAVLCVDITVTLPPRPMRVASALTVAPARISVRAAVIPFARPIAMVPPPPGPEAVTRAVAASVTVPVAAISILPPTLVGARLAALISPLMMTEPPVDWMRTLPGVVPAALMRPPASTRLVTMASACPAVSSTRPPSATMEPELRTPLAGAAVSMERSPSP